MENDEMQLEVLADGTIKSITPVISETNHSSASKFFKLLGELTGGEVSRDKRHSHHVHEHEHTHVDNKLKAKG